LDDSRSPLKIGRLTIVHAGYGAEALRDVRTSVVEEQLAAAEAAFKSGQRLGLIDAWDLLRAERPNEPLPPWVLEGIGQALRAPDSSAAKKKGGRHARKATLRTQRRVDYLRAMEVNRYLEGGATHNGAFQLVSQKLVIEVDGERVANAKNVIAASYRRFYCRLACAPWEFYPSILTPLNILEALMAAPANGIATKTMAACLRRRAADHQ
jgi:hypothetical protein